ncbi:unnamed protein product [Phaeothamnion confervicola]
MAGRPKEAIALSWRFVLERCSAEAVRLALPGAAAAGLAPATVALATAAAAARAVAAKTAETAGDATAIDGSMAARIDESSSSLPPPPLSSLRSTMASPSVSPSTPTTPLLGLTSSPSPLRPPSSSSSPALTVVCVKWGTKYGVEYVNRLAWAIRRHLPLPHRFVCLADDATCVDASPAATAAAGPAGEGAGTASATAADTGAANAANRTAGGVGNGCNGGGAITAIQGAVEVRPLAPPRPPALFTEPLHNLADSGTVPPLPPSPSSPRRPLPPYSLWRGWWLKACLFRRGALGAPAGSPVLYLDLDTVVVGDLSGLAAACHDVARGASGSNSVGGGSSGGISRAGEVSSSSGAGAGGDVKGGSERRSMACACGDVGNTGCASAGAVGNDISGGAACFAVLSAAAVGSERRCSGYNSSVMVWAADDPSLERVYSFLALAYEQVTACVYKFDHFLEMAGLDATPLDRICPGCIVEYNSLPVDLSPASALSSCRLSGPQRAGAGFAPLQVSGLAGGREESWADGSSWAQVTDSAAGTDRGTAVGGSDGTLTAGVRTAKAAVQSPEKSGEGVAVQRQPRESRRADRAAPSVGAALVCFPLSPKPHECTEAWVRREWHGKEAAAEDAYSGPQYK